MINAAASSAPAEPTPAAITAGSTGAIVDPDGGGSGSGSAGGLPVGWEVAPGRSASGRAAGVGRSGCGVGLAGVGLAGAAETVDDGRGTGGASPSAHVAPSVSDFSGVDFSGVGCPAEGGGIEAARLASARLASVRLASARLASVRLASACLSSACLSSACFAFAVVALAAFELSAGSPSASHRSRYGTTNRMPMVSSSGSSNWCRLAFQMIGQRRSAPYSRSAMADSVSPRRTTTARSW